MVAYGEFRRSFRKDPQDQRIVVYGVQYVLEHYVARQWTTEDVEKAEKFFNCHNAGFTSFPFPKDLFLKIVHENNGYFPVKLQVVPDGSVVYPHVPIFQITATDEFARFVTYLETVLTMIWYPSTVATLSRRMWQRISDAFELSVDPKDSWAISSRLHDFGFRACTSVEQSIIGGSAHLLNFEGTDTLSAAYYAQYYLNRGEPVGSSIPATEHSIMLAHRSEREALMQLLETFGAGACACVMDSFDYVHALEKILPSVAKKKVEMGGYLVLRPDSGDPVEAVLLGLKAADKCFGTVINSKGYKVIRGAGVIQGDAVTSESLQQILLAVTDAGYAANNVAFGMGGGLLQKVNRDDMSFATKLCLFVGKDGAVRNVMKQPKLDKTKYSLPGELAVVKDPETGIPQVFPKESVLTNSQDLLRCVYDKRPLVPIEPHSEKSSIPESESFWLKFSSLKQQLQKDWSSLPKIPTIPIISDKLSEKISTVSSEIQRMVYSD